MLFDEKLSSCKKLNFNSTMYRSFEALESGPPEMAGEAADMALSLSQEQLKRMERERRDRIILKSRNKARMIKCRSEFAILDPAKS